MSFININCAPEQFTKELPDVKINQQSLQQIISVHPSRRAGFLETIYVRAVEEARKVNANSLEDLKKTQEEVLQAVEIIKQVKDTIRNGDHYEGHIGKLTEEATDLQERIQEIESSQRINKADILIAEFAQKINNQIGQIQAPFNKK